MQARIFVLMVCCALALGCAQPSSNTQPGTSQVSASPASPSASPASPAASAATTPVGNANAGSPAQKIDSCKLLTSDELKSVQGESLKETKVSDRTEGGFSISQCFYSLPTFTKSVSLAITSAGTRDPKEYWKETFHREEEKEREGKEKASKKDSKESKEPRGKKKEEFKPEKVAGLGDEAFWIGSPIGGALYVLKKDVFFRLSLGGTGDQKSLLNKSKTLSGKILERL